MHSTSTIPHPAHVPAARVVDFDIYQPLQPNLDFHASWKALQDSTLPDVVWTPHNGGHWMVLRGRLVSQVLSDYSRFSNRTVLVPKETAGEAYRLLPLSLDPPAHAPFRNLLSKGLSPQAVSKVESAIRTLTIGLIEGFRLKGQCNFTHDFAEQLPIRIFMQIVALPLADMPRLKYLADQFTRPDGSMEFKDVRKNFQAYIAPVIHERRGTDGTDMLSRMINGKVNDRPLTDEEAANLCIQVLVGGLDTVVNFLGFVMLFLARDPVARRTLAAQPTQIGVAINELARRFPLVTVGREVIRDMDYEGVPLKQGEMIVAPTILHGLDETENPAALAVDFKRETVQHSTFGNGSHTCPGAHLARTETRILIEEWLARIPEFAVASGFEITYTGGIVGSVNTLPLTWEVNSTRDLTPIGVTA
ncbi:MAG: cytochrome P450 [Gammaproteobacteria bacterium]|nr:cytochrome P450 [Gammaproteobacteria bacterium]